MLYIVSSFSLLFFFSFFFFFNHSSSMKLCLVRNNIDIEMKILLITICYILFSFLPFSFFNNSKWSSTKLCWIRNNVNIEMKILFDNSNICRWSFFAPHIRLLKPTYSKQWERDASKAHGARDRTRGATRIFPLKTYVGKKSWISGFAEYTFRYVTRL